jgi:hypothetical protein
MTASSFAAAHGKEGAIITPSEPSFFSTRNGGFVYQNRRLAMLTVFGRKTPTA